MSRTLHRTQRTGSCQYCWPLALGAGPRSAASLHSAAQTAVHCGTRRRAAPAEHGDKENECLRNFPARHGRSVHSCRVAELGLAARPGLLPDASRTLTGRPAGSGPYRPVGQSSATVSSAGVQAGSFRLCRLTGNLGGCLVAWMAWCCACRRAELARAWAAARGRLVWPGVRHGV
jgi:hypothetical protein